MNRRILLILLMVFCGIFSGGLKIQEAQAAAPTVASRGTGDAVTTGDLTLTLPSSITQDDIIVVAVIYWSPASTSNIDAMSTPAGYTQIAETGTPASGTIDGRIGYFWKRAVGGETTVTITRPTMGGGSASDTGNDTCFAGQSYRITGANTTGNPWDGAVFNGPSTSTTVTYSAVTVSAAERTLLAIQAIQDNVATATPPSTYTVVGAADNGVTGTDYGFAAYYKSNVSSDGSVTNTVSTLAQGYWGSLHISFRPKDSDGNLVACSTISEPVAISSIADTVGERVGVFDFTISDGGTSDGLALGVTQIVLHTSGTGTFSDLTWQLYGPDADVTGTVGSGIITFSGLSISVANGASENYTIYAYFSTSPPTSTDGKTFILSVDGDTDLTVNGSGTQMGTTSPVNNGTGSWMDVVATKLKFTTQPPSSATIDTDFTGTIGVSGTDVNNNVDKDFTADITLSAVIDITHAAPNGVLSSTDTGELTKAPTNGTATWTDTKYTYLETIDIKATSGSYTEYSTAVTVSPPTITVASSTNQAPYVAISTTDNIMGSASIKKSAGTGTVTAVTLHASGTGIDVQNDLANAELWLSSDDNWNAGDTLLGTSNFDASGDATITQSFDVDTNYKYLIVRLDIQSTATIGDTIEIQIKDITTSSNKSGLPTNITGTTTVWKKRMQLTFDNSGQAENLANFPVLVKLTTSRITYADVGKADGTDLRFVDTNHVTELKYHIEKWNSSGDSFIWVKVPQIDASSSTDYMWMYYGNSGAADVQDAANTFPASNNFMDVYHFAETSGNYLDSSSNANHGTSVTVTSREATGQIGLCPEFNGSSNNILCGKSYTLGDVTIEAWVSLDTAAAGAIIQHAKINDLEADNIVYNLETDASQNLYARWEYGAGIDEPVTSTANVPLTTWTYVAEVRNVTANTVTWYINGVQSGNATSYTNDPTGGTDASCQLVIGYRVSSTLTYWDGKIDELRVSGIIRTAAWIKASYLTQSDQFITSYPPTAAATISSAANQTFTVGDFATAISTITITDNATTATITAANDIRIKIPSTFNMTWATSDTAANIGGTDWDHTGAASSGAEVTVTFEDSNKTVVIPVTINFEAGDDITVYGLSFASFTATSSADNLELEVDNAGTTVAYDNKTKTINEAGAGWTAYNDLSGGSSGNVTNYSSITGYTSAGYLVNYDIGTTLSTYLSVTGDTQDASGLGAISNAGTDGYNYFNGKLNCTGLISYATGNTVFTFTGLNSSKKYKFVFFGNRADPTYTDRTSKVIISDADSFTADSSTGVTRSTTTTTDDSATYCTGYNTVNGYVAAWTNINPGADGDFVITVTLGTHQYSNVIMLQELTAAPTISSAANQSFTVGQSTTAISTITITDNAATPTITATNDIRIKIPSTFNMTWATSDTAANIGGTDWDHTGAASSGAEVTVTYEDSNKTVVVPVTIDFEVGDDITVYGLSFASFTAASSADNLELETDNAGTTADEDDKTKTITTPTLVQQATNTHTYGSPATSITATLSSGATAGNLLVTTIATDKSAGSYTVPSGFTPIHDYIGPSISGAMAYKIATGGETAITWSYATSEESSAWVGEYSGLASSNVLDVSAEADSADVAVTSQTTGTTATTSMANELAVAMFGIDSALYATGRSWTNSFTEVSFVGASNTAGLGVATKTLSSTGTQTTTASWVTADQACGAIATFKTTAAAATISSAANQSFTVGQSTTAISTITITDNATTATITAANDIRIKIPSTFNMTWATSDATANIAGTDWDHTGAASQGAEVTVTYEDSDKTVVIPVTINFEAGDDITVYGLSFASFTAASSADNLELEVDNAGTTVAYDDKTITTAAAPSWTAYNDCGNDGDIATYGSPGNVTNFGVEFAPTSGNLIKHSDGTSTGASFAYSGTGLLEHLGTDESHGNPSYPPSGDAATEFGTIINMGKISYASPGSTMTVTLSGVSSSRTYTLVALGMRGNNTYYRWSAYTISNVSSYTNSSSAGIPEADRTGATTKYNAGDNWANGYVAKWTNVVPTSNTITLTVTGVAYGAYAAHNGYLSAIKLVDYGAAATISSAANQTFEVGDSATAISTITITDNATTATITAANDIRIKIPSTFNMTWSTSDATANIAGTDWDHTGAASSGAEVTVTYEDSNKTVVIPVAINFEAGDDITVYGLSFASFTATSSADNLELEVDNAGTTVAYDDKTITTAAAVFWTAYNDLAGGSSGNVTNYSSVTGYTSAGYLVNYDTGATLDAYLSVTGDTGDWPSLGAISDAGTDGYNYFNGKLNCTGIISYAAGNTVFTFTGLNSNKKYKFVFFGNRADPTYTGRTSKVIISDADSFTADSSAGVTISTTTTTDDSATYCTGYNTVNGYVAAWTNINPGADGDFVITVTLGTHQYSNAIMLQELTAAPTISSAANQSFTVGQSTTAISTITITDNATTATITAANDIRIKIPSTFNMTWATSDATANIAGTDWDHTGAASQGAEVTVTYEDSDKTVVIPVTINFEAGDDITVYGLSFASFTAASSADNLELEVDNAGTTVAYDDKTKTITVPSYTVLFYADARPGNAAEDGMAQLTVDFNQADNQMESGWALTAVQNIGDVDPITATGGSQNVDGAYNASELKTVYDLPHFFAVGNHEAETTQDMTDVRAKYSGYPAWNLQAGPTGSASTTYSYDVGEMHIVVINEYWDGATDDAYFIYGAGNGGYIHNNLFTWLRDNLRASTKPYKIVVGHEPGYPVVNHIGDSLDADANNRNKFFNLLRTERVIAYGTGHDHHYHIPEYDGVFEADTGVAGCMVGGGNDNFATLGYAHYDSSGFKIRMAREDPTAGWSSPWVTSVTRSDLENQVMVNTADGAGTRCSYFIDYYDEDNPNWTENNSSKWWENEFSTTTAANWSSGELSVGYDTTAWSWMNPDKIDKKNGVYGTFIRVPFTCYDKDSYSYMKLQVDYDDAVTVWLNGTKIYEAANSPDVESTPNDIWDKTASSAHTADGDGDLNPDYTNGTFDVSSYMSEHLYEGSNILAIGNWNDATGSDDLAAGIKLSLTKEVTTTNLSGYQGGTPTVPPSYVNTESTGNCLGTFKFDGVGTISQITLTQYGTCDAPSDLENVKLFKDDGDGNWELGYDTTQLGSTTTFSGVSSTATFSGFSLVACSTCYAHVVLDVKSTASHNATVGIEILQASDVTSTNYVSVSSWPVRLSTSTIKDATPPEAVTTLSTLTGTYPGEIELSWTSPGDDGWNNNFDSGSTFDIRLSTVESQSPAISTSTFASCSSVSEFSPIPTPVTALWPYSMTITGLTPGVTYYFAMKTADEVPNWSGLSNGATTWAQVDNIAPEAVTTLSALTGTYPGEIELSWTSPGDDGWNNNFDSGSTFDIRLSTVESQSPAISTSTFASCSSVSEFSPIPTPVTALWPYSMTITGLTEGVTYYFAIRTRDEIPNWSGLSNGATTWACRVAPAAITDLTGQCYSDTGEVTLYWSTPGDDGWNNTLPEGSKYIIDYSSYSIQWSTATFDVEISTSGVAPYTQVSHTITGLTGDTTWYFQIWTRDEIPTNWSGLSNGATVWVNPVLSVSISTDTYNFGEFYTSTISVSGTNITVINDGNVKETYSIKCSSFTTHWLLKNTPGNDEFALQAAFHPSQPDNDDISWKADDILTESLEQCTTAVFSINGDQHGKDVSPFESNIRNFWFRLKTPLSTSTTTQQNITVTISAEQGSP